MANPFRNKNKPAAPQATSAPTASAPSTHQATSTRPAATNQPNGQSNANATKPGVRIESKPAGEPSSVTPSAIAEAAYFLWLQRGGSETANWLEAERMLKTKVATR